MNLNKIIADKIFTNLELDLSRKITIKVTPPKKPEVNFNISLSDILEKGDLLKGVYLELKGDKVYRGKMVVK